MNCVNRHSTEFKNLVKELNIHPDLVEVYVHTYQNSQYALDYQKKHGDLPFPSKAYIEEQFLTNTATGPKAIKDWARVMCRYDFGNKEFINIQAARNAQKTIARQLKIPVSKVPLVCTIDGKYKVMYNRPSINSTKELAALIQSLGIVHSVNGKLMLNYLNEDLDGYFDAIERTYKLLDSLNITREAINIHEGEVTLKQDFSDTPKVLTSENPTMQRSVLEERKKLGTLNHPFATRGSKKNDAKYLKQGSISQHVQTVILKALEANPALRQFTPLQVFNMITKQYEGDIAEDYEKHIKKPVIAALEKHLTDYLKKYNVEIREDAEQFGEDVFGVYDILNKTIHLAKNRNALTLTEEFAHAFIELLGSKVSNKVENKDYTFLYNNVEETSIYKKVFEEYKDTYKNKYGKPDIAKIKKEAIGQALAVAINNQWESIEEKEKGWFQAIKDWFLKLLDHFSDMEYVNFDTLINKMAKEVIQKDYSRLNKVDSKDYKLLDYAETFAEQAKIDNGKALEFMQTFCKEFGAVITGSIAYRYQGTVYRKSADALHDIDMVIQKSAHGISTSSPVIKAAIRNNTYGSNHLLNVLKEQPYFKAVQAKYPNLELLAAYSGAEGALTVNSIYSDNPELRERFRNLKGSYAKRLESFTEEEKKQIYLFDFFLGEDTEDYVEDPERNIFLKDNNSIFKAKLNIGRAKDIFDYQMWSRYEDFHNSKISSEDYLMYQKKKVTYDMFNPQQKETTDNVVEFLQSKESSDGYYLISGKAGTGKTTIINEIINKYSQNTGTKPAVYVGAISNKATQVLAGKIDVIVEAQEKQAKGAKATGNTGSGSIAAIFGQTPNYDEDGNEIWDMSRVFALLQAAQEGNDGDMQDVPPISTFNSNTILFIDECSMLDETKMFILEAFQKIKGFKMIMMGDAGQVEPVKTNATVDYSNVITSVFPDLASLYEKQDKATTPTTSLSFKHTSHKSLLTERMRQGEDNPILMQADMFWQVGTYDLPLNPLDLDGTTCVDLSTGSGIIYQNVNQDSRNPLESVAEIVQQGIAENNPDKVRIVAYTNKAVQQANEAVYTTLHPETNKAERAQQVVKDKEVLTWYNSQHVQFKDKTEHTIVNSESLIVTNGSEPISLENDPTIAEGLKKLKDGVKFPEAVPAIPKDIKMQYVTATIEGKQVTFAIVCPGSRLAYKEYKAKLFGFMTKCSANKWWRIGGAKKAWESVTAITHPGEVALGYAITTHKSQGSTFDVTVVNYEDFKKASAHKNPNASEQEKANQKATIARLLYTAYTRSSNITFVYHTNDSDNLDNGYQNQSQSLRELNDAANKAKGRKVTPVTPVTKKPLTQQVKEADDQEDSWKSINEKIDKMFAMHADKISFDEATHTYYYHPQGKTGTVKEVCTSSVTTYTTPFEATDNPVVNTAGDIATRLGNTVDTFLRDYFDKGSNYWKTQNYPNLNDKDKEALAEIAGKLKQYLDKLYGDTKYTARTADFSLIGKIKDEEGNYQLTGGTVDMIIFDEEGNYRILDFKTSRTDITGNDHHKLDSYKDQVNTYRVMFEKMHPEYAGKFKGGMLFQMQTSYKPSEGNWSFAGKQIMHNGINIQNTADWTAPKLFGPLGGTIGASIIQIAEAHPQKHWYQNGEFKSAPMEIIGPREVPKTDPVVKKSETIDLKSDAYNTLSFDAYRPITLGGYTFQSLAHATIARIAYGVDQAIYNEILGIDTYNPNIFYEYMQKLQASPNASNLSAAINRSIVKIADDIKQGFTDQNKAVLLATEDKAFEDSRRLPVVVRETYQNALSDFRTELRTPQPVTQLPSNAITVMYKDRSTPYWQLSNMAERKFQVGLEGLAGVSLTPEDTCRKFSSVEQAFQYIKVKYFGTSNTKDAIADQILASNNPFKIRTLGQNRSIGLNTSEWDNMSQTILQNLINISFKNNSEARRLLIKTGDAEFLHPVRGKYATVFPAMLKAARLNSIEVLKEFQGTLADKIMSTLYNTSSCGVVVDPQLKANWQKWQEQNPEGIVAYRVNFAKYNSPEEAKAGRIGNPFSETSKDRNTVKSFLYWLLSGDSQGNPKATKEYRQAIIQKLLSIQTPNILYYKELGRPSHATILGYLIGHKELLLTPDIILNDKVYSDPVHLMKQGNLITQDVVDYSEYFQPHTSTNVETKDVEKPWKSDNTKTNPSRQFFIKGKEEKGYFELVKDEEDGFYSIHFKSAKGDKTAFTYEEKQELTKAVMEAIPEGSYLSTWGEISKGGINGLRRIASHNGFVKVDERTLTLKGTKEPVAVPVILKESSKATRIANKHNSDAYNKEGKKRLATGSMNHPGIKEALDRPGSKTVAVFTDNAQAYTEANNRRGNTPLDTNWIAPGYNKGTAIRLNVEGQGNSAALRARGENDIRYNAIGLTVKKYQQKTSSNAFLAKEGQFQDTDSDFALFKALNRHAIARIKKGMENGAIDTVIFPRQMALGRAALPYRFAEWLLMELNDAFDAGLTIEDNIQKTPNSAYEGYGLNLETANFTNSKEDNGRPVEDAAHPAASYTLHSGGATGSDYAWGKHGEQWGLGKANHYYTGAPTTKYMNTPISTEDLEEAKKMYPIAAQMLGRKTSDNEAVAKLMQRDWAQAKYADALYGIIEDFDDGVEYKQPKGGTGYALMYGVMLHKPVYVFSEATGKWYKAHYDEAGQFTRFREYNNTKGENMTPTLTKDFAGIGTRNIHQTGQDAIEAVYQKTFNTIERQKGIIEEEAQYENDQDYVNKVIKDAVSAQAQADRKAATKRFFTEKEKELIEAGVGKVVVSGRTLVPLKVFSASRHTDAIFYVDQIINDLKKNAEYPIGHPKRVYAMEFWSKHDGIPMIKILEACKKYRVAPMVSFSITSLGGTEYEPGVMKPKDLIVRIKDLLAKGYLDPATTTVRLDPIVPGVTKIEDLQEIVSELKAVGITKYVTSLMQSYGYTEGTSTDRGTIKAMADKGYNWDDYYDRETKGSNKGKLRHYPKPEVIQEWREALHKLRDDNGIILESCAFNNLKLDVSACLDPETIKAVTGIENLEESTTKERQACKCYGHKSDLLALTDECYSSCAYCYAAQSDSNPLRFYDDEGNLIDDKYGITRTELTEEEAENLRKEEAESEAQKLAKLPMTPGIAIDKPSSLFTPEDIELIQQRETLINCNLFTGTQLMDLARAAALKLSEVITRLASDPNAKQEYFPEGSKWLDKDYTSMSRIEIINTLTPATIFSIVRETTFTGVNNPNIDKIKRKNLKKLFFISQNWRAFLEMTLKPLMNTESISINNAVGQIVDLSTAEDTLLDDPQEVAETLGSSVETWQIGFRQISAHNSLSQALKSFLGNLDKIDESKIDTEGMVPKMTEFGTVEKVDSSEVVNKILLWCQGARTLSEMIEKLEAHDQRADPWIVQVIDALEDENNSTFQSQFFSNFKKYFQPYIIQYRKGGPDGPLMHKVINNKTLGSAILEEYQAKWQSRKDNTLSLYTKEGRISMVAAKSINAQVASLVTIKDNVRTEQSRPIRHLLEVQDALMEPSDTDYKNAAQSLQIVAAMFDIDLSDTAAMTIVQNEDTLKKVWQDIVYINRAIQGNLNDINYSLYTDSKITSNLQELFEILTNGEFQLESCSYENGKMHYSYVTPSYLTNLVDKLKGNVADYGEMMEKEYGQYGWFKKGNQWRLEILDKLAKDASYRENFGHYVLLSTDKIGYTEKSPKDYVMSMLQLYFSGTTYDTEGNPTHSKWGFFRVPIMSNKPSEEYIRMEKYTGKDYKKRIKEQLLQMIEQEADRINTCRERVKQGKETIKNFDTNGQKFIMMSFMQKYLEAYHKAKKLDPALDFTNLYSRVQNSLANKEDLSTLVEDTMYQAAIGNILEKMIDNSYASNPIEDALLNQVLDTEIIAQYKDFVKYLQSQGVIFTNEDLSPNVDTLKECGLGMTAEMVMDNLENFFWNDFLGANVIMQLTITDTAYYTDTEDLQKRLAQIHAPGLRCNIEATWEDPKTHQQVRVADEHTRTIYLKDFDKVVSSAIENVRQIFQAKYEKLLEENPEEAATFKETSNAIVEQFKGINVADAQGYSSITSYRKKAIMFGKWSNQLEDTYQKIRSGKYTSRDLNMALQPLKPFVYSNTKKSSPGTLGNLKVGVQNKNSEYLLIMLDAITQGEKGAQSSKLSAIYSLMEESHYDEKGNYKTDGIDTVQFESTVKAGLQGAIDINNAKDTAEAKQILENAVYTNGRGSQYKEEVVHVLNFEDYCLQSEVPAHLEGSSIFGSQIRILSLSDLPLQTNGVENTIKFRGEDITVKQLKDIYNKANVDNIYHSFNTLVKELNLTGTQADRNIAISQLLQDTIKKDGRYGYELLYAVSTDEYGRFNMSLSDPTIASQVQSLLNSLIKTRINKQQIEGGPVVQVTNYGTSQQLEIRFKDKEGNELPTLKEFYESRMSSPAAKFAEKYKVTSSKKETSETSKYSFQEFIDMAHYENTSDPGKEKLYKEVYLPIIEAYKKEVVSKQHSMAYMECYAPSTVFEEYADDKGFIDINKVPKEKLELIGYRIPTESKYSMAPLRIKGFLPHEAGEGIMLPYEITLLSGSDFDEINVKVKLC